MTINDLNIGDQVLYVPDHAMNDHNHPSCEYGLVSSKNERFAFVRYIRDRMLQSTAQATDPRNLFHIGDPFPSGFAIAELQGQIRGLHELIEELRKAHISALELSTKEKS